MTYPAPYPICPRCQSVVDVGTGHTEDRGHRWHWKCWHAYRRDREWLTEAEVIGAVE